MQQISQEPMIQFNKGLITEAGELTFPQGASVAELNCSLQRDGSRRRRLAVEYEGGAQLSADTLPVGTTTSIDLWENAGSQAGLNLIVVQVGSLLLFYRETKGALSENQQTFGVDLTAYARPNTLGVETEAVQLTTLSGFLVVASPEINTFVIEYDPATESISASEIEFRIRDFEWQGDRRTYSEAEASPDVGRTYDTLNAGWNGSKGSAALSTYQSARSNRYPPLSLPWYSGKDADGNFDVSEFEKVFAGSSLIANGSFTYDLYNIDRSTNSAGAEDYVEDSRFRTVEAFAGRVFYAGMANKNTSRVYFSRTIEQLNDLGELLQVNDPTSEDFSDLLDTDGGFVNIPDAYNIQRLHTLGSQLLVFAENGLWAIRGLDDVFRATDYSVFKISGVGLTYPRSFVSASGRPYWWSDAGIHTVSVSAEQQSLAEQNLSLTTIQTYFAAINNAKRFEVVGAYDAFNNRVGWFYPSNDEAVEGKLTQVLFFDEQLSAFYPWAISDGASGQYVLSPLYVRGNGSSDNVFNVVDSDGNQIVDSLGNTVVTTRASRGYSSSALSLLVRDPSGSLTFARFTGTDFYDWGLTSYKSYAEGAYDFSGDLTLKKSPVYVTVYMGVTEEAIELDEGVPVGYIRPSGCLVSSFWDFRTTPSQKPQQAYRLRDLPQPDGSFSTLSYPRTVTTSRLRLRGYGRSHRLRFEGEDGKDFLLLGYDLITGRNTRL